MAEPSTASPSGGVSSLPPATASLGSPISPYVQATMTTADPTISASGPTSDRPVPAPARRETEIDGAGWVVLPPPASSPSTPTVAPGSPPSSPVKVSRTDKVVNKIASVLAGSHPAKRSLGPPTPSNETPSGGTSVRVLTGSEPTLSPIIVPRDHAPMSESQQVDTPVRANSVQETDPAKPPDDCTVAPPSKDDTVVFSLDQPQTSTPTAQPTRSDTSATITPEMHARSQASVPGNGQSAAAGGAMRTALGDVIVPKEMQDGMTMLKVSAKKIQQKVFKLDADKGTIEWGSRKGAFVNIESIRELRLTTSARSFIDQLSLSSPLSPSYASRWITIIYTAPETSSTEDLKWKTLHMVAPSPRAFDEWSRTLQALWEARRELMGGIGALDTSGGDGVLEERKKNVWMRKQWREAEVKGEVKKGTKGAPADAMREGEKEGWLDFEGVVRVCRRLNIASSRQDLLERFKDADSSQAGHLDFVAFQRFVQKLKRRLEIEKLFEQMTFISVDGRRGLDLVQFQDFLRQVQKSSLSDADIAKVHARYATSSTSSIPATNLDSTAQEEPLLLLDGFTSFLTSSDNSAFAEPASKVTHDMTRPLPEYFVSSSHNTYLIGHQLVGDSTVEGYIRALLQGCRSVELDCWDGDDGQPVIYHGRTFTGKVTVRDVVHAIGKYAFVASPYPVIISAEIHCDVKQQEALVTSMKEILGQRFLDRPLEGRAETDALPSPEELKYNILLKAKVTLPTERGPALADLPPLEQVFSTTDTDSASGLREDKYSRRSSNSSNGLVSRVRRRLSLQSSSSSESSHDSFTLVHAATFSTLPPERSSSGSSAKTKPCSPALADVLVYTLGVKYRGFNKKETYSPSHMVSLSEKTCNKVLKQSFADVVKHNRTHMMRLYPSVTRLTSSNYDPIRYWAAGAQLVAINWQSADLGYLFNGAMFARNGRAGYVLKPAPLRIKAKEESFGRVKHQLKVRVISAQQLPTPSDFLKRDSMIDPFVEVTVFTPSLIPPPSSSSSLQPPSEFPPSQPSTVSKPTIKLRTRTVEDNGFNPAWNETLLFDFEGAEGMEDLVFVRFDVRYEGEVVDMFDKSVGSYCVPLGALNMGYRHLPLQDQHLNQFLFSSVFVHLDLVTTLVSSPSAPVPRSPRLGSSPRLAPPVPYHV